MKRHLGVFLLIFLVVSLAGCGSGNADGEDDEGNLQNMKFKDYEETVNADDYTGFAYLIYGEDDYLSILGDIFENQDAKLVYHDNLEASDKEQQQYDEDSTKNLDFLQDKIGYFKNGRKISEIDITSSIEKSEGYDEVEEFVNKHKD